MLKFRITPLKGKLIQKEDSINWKLPYYENSITVIPEGITKKGRLYGRLVAENTENNKKEIIGKYIIQ